MKENKEYIPQLSESSIDSRVIGEGIGSTRYNPTITKVEEENYHPTLSGKVKIILGTIIMAATFLTAGCFSVPAEEYGLTKVVLDSPAKNKIFTTKENNKEINFKWGKSIIYQVDKYLSERGLTEEEVGITYTLRIDNDNDMSSPEQEVETSGLEEKVKVNKGTHYWQVGAKIVTKDGEKCIYAEPEQYYTEEEMLSEIWKFIINKTVTPTPDPGPVLPPIPFPNL